MPGQRKELYMEKLHLEMALNKKKGRVEVGAERKGVRDMFASMTKLATVRPAAAVDVGGGRDMEEGRLPGAHAKNPPRALPRARCPRARPATSSASSKMLRPRIGWLK